MNNHFTINVKKDFSDFFEKTYNIQIRCRNLSKSSCVKTGEKYQRTCFCYKDIGRKRNNFIMLYNTPPHA